MKLKFFPFCFLVISIALLSGCEKTKQALGQSKEGPDEFSVYQRAPLSLPPNYGLKPPTPGVTRPQAAKPRNRAIQALGIKESAPSRKISNTDDNANMSPGEQSLLKITGALNADSSIRSKIENETNIMATENEAFTDKIAFWQSNKKFGTVIDPKKEAQRIRTNLASGLALNKGQYPTIKRKNRAILQGIFN